MTAANVALYSGLVILIVLKRVQGGPVASPRQLFLLPVILTAVGAEDLSRARLGPVDIAVTVAGLALSLALGGLRGTRNRISYRNSIPWVRWGGASVIIFAVNVVTKLLIDGAGIALGGSASGITASLLLAAGLMLVGEAAVVWVRILARGDGTALRPGGAIPGDR